jgi:hypothetical protein
LALHGVLRILDAQPESICHWLDTEGSFAPDRAKSVLESMGIQVSLRPPHVVYKLNRRMLHRFYRD